MTHLYVHRERSRSFHELVDGNTANAIVEPRRILGFRVASPDEFTTALEMALDGRITVPVDRTFRLSEAGEAHAYMDERRHIGKIVLVRE